MNDMMILLARMRHDEMLREADEDKRVTRLRHTARRAARTAAGPVIRRVVPRARPTVTGPATGR